MARTTFTGGMGGDNWNLDLVKVTARGDGVDEIIVRKEGAPLYRFTGERKSLTLTH